MVIKSDYLFSKAIPVGDYFGADPDAATITLREIDGKTAAKFQKTADDLERSVPSFLEMLPQIIEDHDLYKDEITKFTGAEVAEMVGKRADLCIHLMTEYITKVLFTHGKKSA